MANVNRSIDRVTTRIRAAREFSIFVYIGATVAAALVSSLFTYYWNKLFDWSFLVCWLFIAEFWLSWLGFHWGLNRYIVSVARMFGQLDAPVKIQHTINPIVVRQNHTKKGTIIRVDGETIFDDVEYSNGTAPESVR